uniref:Glycosyltransferase RgtA/B/C/D-like domain-containing protein n=1 Tax=Eiseniibacteriota bacterium TaxID=2212470 RepID=A0A832I550_UNCEI
MRQRHVSKGAGGPAKGGGRAAAAPARPRGPRPYALHGSPQPAESTARWLGRGAWALIALTGAALLAMALGPHRIGDYFTESDFYGAYAEGARLFQRGALDPSRYGVVGPGYEVVLGLVGFAIRDLFLAAELISVAATLATLALWWRILAARAGARVALAALAFMATNAFLFRYGYAATTDALALALQSAAFAALLLAGSPRAAFAAGLLAAAAFLTRYSGVWLLPAGLAAIAWGGTPHAARRQAGLLFAVGFAAPVAPWVLWSLAHGGSLEFQLHHNLAYEVFARARGLTWDEYQRDLQPQFPTLASVLTRDPQAVIARLFYNAFDHLRLDARLLLGWPVAAAAALGLVLGALDGSLRRLWPLWLSGALACLVLVPAFHSERYSLAALPFYATLAGIAFGSPRFAFALKPSGVWLKTALALVPLAFAVAASARVQARAIDQLPVEVLDAAQVLRERARPGDKVIARKAHIAWHGGVQALPFPFADSLGALAENARESGARWLYFSWPEAQTRPSLFALLDTAARVPGLTPRAVTRPHPAVLYEIGPGFGEIPSWYENDTLRQWHTLRGRLMVDGRDADALYGMALLERIQGRLGRAREYAARAIALRPRDLRTNLAFGAITQETGDFGASERAFRTALELDPRNAGARIGLGWALVMQERPREAAGVWREVVDVAPDPETLEAMAGVFELTGEAALAARARARLSGAP